MTVYYYRQETGSQKLFRKAKSEPLVPMGVVATCGALYMAGRALRAGDSKLANRMFIWRVAFQGFTVAALVFGGLFAANRLPINRDDVLKQKAKEREALWIQELERIDQEAKDRQKRAQSIQESFLKRRHESAKEALEKQQKN